MLSSSLRIKIVAAISAATAGTALAAQSAAQRPATPALRLERADTVGAQTVYTYAIYGGTAEKAGVESVRLDVSTPRGKYQPSILGVRGVFLMDALRDIEDSNIGHPPLFIGTPNGWFGAIAFTGDLDWLTDSPNGIRTKGVGPGEKLGPLILKSPALPAFRKWTVARNQPLPREEDQVLYWPGEGGCNRLGSQADPAAGWPTYLHDAVFCNPQRERSLRRFAFNRVSAEQGYCTVQFLSCRASGPRTRCRTAPAVGRSI
jgi:hypothetical protein